MFVEETLVSLSIWDTVGQERYVFIFKFIQDLEVFVENFIETWMEQF